MTIKNYVHVVTAVILSACGETEIESPELTLDDAKTTETEIEATVPFHARCDGTRRENPKRLHA